MNLPTRQALGVSDGTAVFERFNLRLFLNTPRGPCENKHTLSPASRDGGGTAEVKGPQSLHKCPSSALQILHTLSHSHTGTHSHTSTHTRTPRHMLTRTQSHLGMHKCTHVHTLIHVHTVTLAHMHSQVYTLTHIHEAINNPLGGVAVTMSWGVGDAVGKLREGHFPAEAFGLCLSKHAFTLISALKPCSYCSQDPPSDVE